MKKPILCLDFDGVCNSYTSGWQGADVIPDNAVPGLFEFLERAESVFEIQVYSSRSNHPGGTQAMQAWFEAQFNKWQAANGSRRSMPAISFAIQKPAAFAGFYL